MALITWRDSYSTGVEYFDKEHEKIVILINELYEVCRDHLAEDVVHRVITELLEYTVYHFEHEEKAMEAVNYAYLEEQREQHDILKKKVQEFKDRLDQREEGVAAELYLFLRDWLIKHILEYDRRYKSALKNKEIKELLGGSGKV